VLRFVSYPRLEAMCFEFGDGAGGSRGADLIGAGRLRVSRSLGVGIPDLVPSRDVQI